jgi:FdhD protein
MTRRERKNIGLVPLPEETILRLTVNGRTLAQMSCSPFDFGELAVGWLFHQGIVNELPEIEGYQVDASHACVKVWLNATASERLDDYTPIHVSACAGGVANANRFDDLAPVQRDYELDVERLRSLMRQIFERETLFREHGGIHCSMLADMEKEMILVSREDIGRGNTVDKVTGWGLFNGIDLRHTALFTTGRISSEMTIKAHRARIATIVSLTTFTSKAYEIAAKTGMTLAGHVLKPHPILIHF